MNDEQRLLKETLDLAEMLASAEAVAGKALEQVATLRRHHRARLGEWQRARGIEQDLPNPARPELPPTVDPEDAQPVTDEAKERHGIVAGALKRAEKNRGARVSAAPITDTEDRPGRGARLSTEADPDDTIETREDGASRPPADSSRPMSDPPTNEGGRSDA